MAFKLFVLVLLGVPSIVLGAEDCPPDESTAKQIVNSASCPNNSQIKALCNVVGNGEEEGADSDNLFVYQTIINNASCVNSTNSPADVIKKVQAFWKKYGKDVYCSNINFEGGSLLRYAAYSRFDSFIDDVANNWKISPDYLNQPDKRDGRSVLDYIRDEIKTANSAAIKQQLQRYYDKLNSAGAKHLK